MSVADPGFSRRGRQPQRGASTYYLVTFSQKLHENEDILDQGGARDARPLRSATACILFKYIFKFPKMFSMWLLLAPVFGST